VVVTAAVAAIAAATAAAAAAAAGRVPHPSDHPSYYRFPTWQSLATLVQLDPQQCAAQVSLV
jgi:hypothetical protein